MLYSLTISRKVLILLDFLIVLWYNNDNRLNQRNYEDERKKFSFTIRKTYYRT